MKKNKLSVPTHLCIQVAPFSAQPWPPTLGCDHTDNHQQREAEAQGEQEEAGSRAETMQERWSGRRP